MSDLTLNENISNKIYDILVEECGANETKRENFVWSMCDSKYPTHEYRFIGNLGFGGKVWNLGHKAWYVSCYKEDNNEVKQKAIDRANEKLLVLWEEFNGR